MRTNSDLDASGRTIYGEEFLLAQAHSLLNFAKGSVAVNGGFGYIDFDFIAEIEFGWFGKFGYAP